MMPNLDGFETTSRIMQSRPVPIVIVSGHCGDSKEVNMSFRAMEAGAVAVVEKPKGIGHPDYKESVEKLISTVKTVAGVKVIKRCVKPPRDRAKDLKSPPDADLDQKIPELKLVAIGASTGGPPVIQSILSQLPKNYPVPLLIVQHIAEGFIKGFAEWLESTS